MSTMNPLRRPSSLSSAIQHAPRSYLFTAYSVTRPYHKPHHSRQLNHVTFYSTKRNTPDTHKRQQAQESISDKSNDQTHQSDEHTAQTSSISRKWSELWSKVKEEWKELDRDASSEIKVKEETARQEESKFDDNGYYIAFKLFDMAVVGAIVIMSTRHYLSREDTKLGKTERGGEEDGDGGRKRERVADAEVKETGGGNREGDEGEGGGSGKGDRWYNF